MIRTKQNLRRRLTAILAVVTALLGVRAGAADLLVPITASSWPDGAAAGAPKERLVRIVRNKLAGARDSVANRGTGRLLFNVDDDLELGVVLERTSPTRWGYSLSGRVDGPTVGFVTLVVHDEAIAGAIWTPHASYEIVSVGSLGSGVHVVREVAHVVRCAHQSAVPVRGDGSTDHLVQNNHPEHGNTVVDVLMVWTPLREEEAGGAAMMRVGAELSIEYANDAFERSGAFVTLNLVGAERVDYEDADERNAHVLFRRLIDPSDGHMDGVHRRRDALGADLVSLDGGLSYRVGLAGGAFNVSPHPITFVHEVGHNFGLSHERDEWYTGYTSTVPRHIEHGHVTGAYEDPFALTCATTIMAYGRRCTWTGSGQPYGRGLYVPIFSSPANFGPLDGQRLGVSRFVAKAGSAGPADAVLHINRIRHAVAAFRPNRSEED